MKGDSVVHCTSFGHAVSLSAFFRIFIYTGTKSSCVSFLIFAYSLVRGVSDRLFLVCYSDVKFTSCDFSYTTFAACFAYPQTLLVVSTAPNMLASATIIMMFQHKMIATNAM